MRFLNFISAKIAAVLISFSVLVFPLNAHAEESLKSEEAVKNQAEEVQEETEEAIQKAADYTQEQIAEYQNRLDSLSTDYLTANRAVRKTSKSCRSRNAS